VSELRKVKVLLEYSWWECEATGNFVWVQTVDDVMLTIFHIHRYPVHYQTDECQYKIFFLFCRGNLLQKLRGKCMNNLRTSPLSSSKNLPLYFFMVLLLNRLYGVDAPGWPRPPPQTASRIRSSAITEGPRDASCQLKSCQLPRNSAETTYTSPDQIDGMKLET